MFLGCFSGEDQHLSMAWWWKHQEVLHLVKVQFSCTGVESYSKKKKKRVEVRKYSQSTYWIESRDWNVAKNTKYRNVCTPLPEIKIYFFSLGK